MTISIHRPYQSIMLNYKAASGSLAYTVFIQGIQTYRTLLPYRCNNGDSGLDTMETGDPIQWRLESSEPSEFRALALYTFREA